MTVMGERHKINEVKGVIVSRTLLDEYGYDGDMPTDEQMQAIGDGLLEYWGVSDGFKDALASTMENITISPALSVCWTRAGNEKRRWMAVDHHPYRGLPRV